MYTAFYGLREKPFALSPDPRFLYLAGSHREALAHLLYGIEQGEGFISVTGEVGTGKTTLCRTLLERLEGDIELAFLFNPSRTALELLQSICAEFGLPAEGLPRRALMAQLNQFLVEKKAEGRRVLLIIDEAQTLSANTLEQVRLLSNLETSRDKLIQILLLGQPELDRKLDERGLRQLRQRISVRWELAPLAPAETRAYVRHRLAVAAGEPKDLFSESALREIHRRTGGVPRLVNQLCDRALLGGYASRAAQIGPRLVRAAAREIPDARRAHENAGRARLVRPWLFFVAPVVLIGLGLTAGLLVGRGHVADRLRDAETASTPGEAIPGRDRDAHATDPSAGPPSVAAPPPLARLIGVVPPEDRLPDPLAAATRNGVGAGGAGGAAGASGSPLGVSPLVEPPRVTALAPGLLGEMLATRNPARALAETQHALENSFGRRVPALAAPPTSARELEAGFAARGLESTPFDGGSLRLLRRLDHPVALVLTPDAGAAADAKAAANARPARSLSADTPRIWIAVLNFEGDRALVAGLVSGREVTVPIAELEAHWLETGIVVWERFERVPDMLALGAEGGSVIWLQRSLGELRFLDAAPTGLYDAATVAAVARFQRERGLVADGIAGPLTQIALYGRIGRYPVPRLSAARPVEGGDRG